MASRWTRKVRQAVRPTRVAINNMLFKKRLNFDSNGGIHMLGFYFIPPRHTVTLQKHTVTLLAESTIDDDLEGEIGSIGVAMDIGTAYDWQTTQSVNTWDEIEDYVLKHLPMSTMTSGQSEHTAIHDYARKAMDMTEEASYGSGHLLLEGYGYDDDAPAVWWTRHKKTHPLYGTGIIANSGDGGAKYTPVDTTGPVNSKRNLTAGKNPAIVAMLVYAPEWNNNTDINDVVPTFSGDEYDNWIEAHNAYGIADALAEPRDTVVTSGEDYDPVYVGAKYLNVRYVDSEVDEGRKADWNCSWRNASYIRRPDEGIPGNISYKYVQKKGGQI